MSSRAATTKVRVGNLATGKQQSQRFDPQESIDGLLRDLETSTTGLSDREVSRRAVVYGLNQLVRQRRSHWSRQVLRQLTHPLALLLWLAAALAWISDSQPLAVAIVAVVIINAGFAFVQERHAEQAVEALSAIIPETARVMRQGPEQDVAAASLVPGDVIHLSEGDRVSADARLIDGSVDVDLSALTGESATDHVATRRTGAAGPLIEATDIVFSGTNIVGGEARAVVFAPGMRTELGRIAALTQRVTHEESPLEAQVKRVASGRVATAHAVHRPELR